MADLNVVRRFLLFKLNLDEAKNPDLVTLDPPSDPTDPRKFDPVDYDDPKSELYWRNVQVFPDYRKRLEKKFLARRNAILSALNPPVSALTDSTPAPTLTLKKYPSPYGPVPYLDLSPYFARVSNYTTQLKDLDNRISLTLHRRDLNATDVQGAGASPMAVFDSDAFGALDIMEDDVLMVRVSYDGGQTFESAPEFLGYVTKIDKTSAYGAVSEIILEAYGISKILYASQAVAQKALRPDDLLIGVELNNAKSPTPFDTNYNEKNTKGIVRYIMEESYACRERQIDDLVSVFDLDPGMFGPYQLGFQYNLFVLLTLYLLLTSETPDNEDSQKLFPLTMESAPSLTYAQLDVVRPLLSQPLGGVEHGEHKAFNEMTTSGFPTWFSQMTYGANILSTVRENAFYDVFESREGTIVVRPPRFNQIELTYGEFDRVRMTTENYASKFLQFDPASASWLYREDADFVIGADDLIGSVTVSHDDMQLESRVDIKGIIPYAGEQDWPTGSYIDPNVLLHRGLRIRSAASNPNAYNPPLAALLAPVALTWANAATRTLDLTVADTRRYRIGKLYYIAPLQKVGFLTNDTINHEYGRVSTRTLSFSMVRSVIQRPISTILDSDNDLINFAVSYLEDVPTVLRPGFTLGQSANASGVKGRAQLIADAKSFLEFLLQEGAPGGSPSTLLVYPKNKKVGEVTIPVFKYLPSILDVVTVLEDTPGLNQKPKPKPATVDQATSQAKEDRTQAVNFGGYFYTIADLKSYPSASLAGVIDTHKNPGLGAIGATNPYQGLGIVLWSRIQSGILNYLQVADYPLVEAVTDKEIRRLYAVKTPFKTANVVTDPNGTHVSQVLINQLARLDLSAKTGKPTFSFTTGLMDWWPQLYTQTAQGFSLFGLNPGALPQAYVEAVRAQGQAYAANETEAILYAGNASLVPKIPNTLNFDGVRFKNQYLQIRPIGSNSTQSSSPFAASSSAVYALPYGHLIGIPNGAGWISRSVFVEVGNLNNSPTNGPQVAGRFQILTPAQTRKPDIYRIIPVGANTYAKKLGNTEEMLTAADVSDASKFIEIYAPKGLSFISPYTDITIERMLDLALPIKYGGIPNAAQMDELKSEQPADASSSPYQTQKNPLLVGNSARFAGCGVFISPDYLIASSQSDLEVIAPMPAMTDPIGSPAVAAYPFYAKFESFLGGQNSVRAAIKAKNLKIPDGTPCQTPDRTLICYLIALKPEASQQGGKTGNYGSAEEAQYAGKLFKPGAAQA